MINNGGNGRRLTKRQTVRLLIGLTILAWATQTLLAQWGLAAPARLVESEPATMPATEESGVAPERFVPGSARFDAGATVEIRSEATVVGEEVRLRQVCRWSEHDEPVLAPIGDLVLARLGPGSPFRTVGIDEIKGFLRDAGVNIAALNFVGAAACTVNRSDVEYDERVALNQWIAAREAAAPTTEPTTQPAESTIEQAVATIDDSPIRSVRRALIEDLAQRLALPPESLQVTFRAEDEKVLLLSEPLFQFQVQPSRARNLGKVSWDLTIVADGKTQKVNVHGFARAWQDQVVLARPLAFKQIIRDDDLIERRALVDRLSDDPLVARGAILGQQAGRELEAGTVLTARMVDPVQLVRPGQYVTISLTQGTVHIKTVAKALEGGTYGQTIRVRNEATREVFNVVLTGPQAATMNLSVATTKD